MSSTCQVTTSSSINEDITPGIGLKYIFFAGQSTCSSRFFHARLLISAPFLGQGSRSKKTGYRPKLVHYTEPFSKHGTFFMSEVLWSIEIANMETSENCQHTHCTTTETQCCTNQQMSKIDPKNITKTRISTWARKPQAPWEFVSDLEDQQ